MTHPPVPQKIISADQGSVVRQIGQLNNFKTIMLVVSKDFASNGCFIWLEFQSRLADGFLFWKAMSEFGRCMIAAEG